MAVVPPNQQFVGVWFHYPTQTAGGQWWLCIGTFDKTGEVNRVIGLNFFCFQDDPAAEALYQSLLDTYPNGFQVALLAERLYAAGLTTGAGPGIVADDYSIHLTGHNPEAPYVNDLCSGDGTQDIGCPQGYYFDIATAACVVLVGVVKGKNPIQPPPPVPKYNCAGVQAAAVDGAGAAALNPPQSFGDDELAAYGDQISAYLYALAGGKPPAIGAPPAATTAANDCCCETLKQLNSIATQFRYLNNNLEAILLEASSPQAQQLAAITNELACICEKIAKLGAGGTTVDLSPLVKATEDVAAAIRAEKPVDVAGIVDQLKLLVGQGDVDQKIFDALKQQGLLSAADLQTLQGIKWSDALAYIESSSPVRALEKFISWIGTDAETVAGWLGKGLAPAGNWAEREILAGLKTERNAIQAPIANILDIIRAELAPKGHLAPGVIGVNPDKILADVAAVGINLYVIGTLVGLIDHGAAEQLMKFAEAITGLLGFEELKEVQLGPLVARGIGKAADVQAAMTYRQEFVGANAGYALHARGIIPAALAETIRRWNGMTDVLAQPLEEAAYGGMNARTLLRLADTDLFTEADYRSELTFAGMRPASQARWNHAAPYIASDPERKQYKAEVVRAAEFGFFDDATVRSLLHSADHNVDRVELTIDRLDLVRRVDSAKALETEYSTLFAAGLLPDDNYRQLLNNLGILPWRISLIMAVQEAKASARLARAEAAALRAELKATDADKRKLVLAQFQQDQLNQGALTAELSTAGLTPIQAAAIGEVAALHKAGAKHWIYGLHKTPQEAQLLSQRVADLKKQFEDRLITLHVLVGHLQALSIPPRQINAIVAAAAAALASKQKGELYNVLSS